MIFREINEDDYALYKQLIQSENGSLDWSSLPTQLHMSGSILREAIQSHSHLRAVSEAGAVFHGISRLVSQPEFSNPDSFLPLLELMDSHPTAVVPEGDTTLGGVWIGQEHPHKALADCSVVQASFRSSSKGIGQVALIGPMRMAYSTAMGAVKSVANHLDKLLS